MSGAPAGISFGENFANPAIAKQLAMAMEGNSTHEPPKRIVNEEPVDKDKEEVSDVITEEDIKDDNVFTLNEKLSVAEDIMSDGDVLVESSDCAMILSPQEIKIEDSFMSIIMDKNKKNNFVLLPGSRFTVYVKTIENGFRTRNQ